MFVISYGLAVATVMPFFRPLATLVSLGRFCGFVGLPLVFMSVLQNTHSTKVALLVFGMGVYTVLSLTKLFDSVPKDLFDHSRTLRMGEWRVVWEVIILGTSAQVIDILRINIAMGWMMLPLVEGRYKSEGGVGALMEIENKHLNLDMVFCAMFLILVVGFLQDYLIGIFKAVAFEWSMLGMERR
jgi:NitT/TauT family transport system permease protein